MYNVSNYMTRHDGTASMKSGETKYKTYRRFCLSTFSVKQYMVAIGYQLYQGWTNPAAFTPKTYWIRRINYLPIILHSVQFPAWKSDPAQVLPLPEGGGLLQPRLFTLWQVSGSHASHEPQLDHCPSTKTEYRIYDINMDSIISQ